MTTLETIAALADADRRQTMRLMGELAAARAALREIAEDRPAAYGLTAREYAHRFLIASGQPASTNAVDPHAQPAGTPTPRATESEN